MPRTRRQIAIPISDDEDDDQQQISSITQSPKTPSPNVKREALKTRTRASRGSITSGVTNGVNGLEISLPAVQKREAGIAHSSDEDDEMSQENVMPTKSSAEPEDAAVLATPMKTPTPLVYQVSSVMPKLQVAHLEPLAPTRKSFNNMLPPMKTNLHLPPPKPFIGESSSSQLTSDGLVAVSPSKGRLRSLAAEQAFQDKDLPPRPRLVISKLVLTNFKSYAGRQEIGPFHTVSCRAHVF